MISESRNNEEQSIKIKKLEGNYKLRTIARALRINATAPASSADRCHWLKRCDLTLTVNERPQNSLYLRLQQILFEYVSTISDPLALSKLVYRHSKHSGIRSAVCRRHYSIRSVPESATAILPSMGHNLRRSPSPANPDGNQTKEKIPDGLKAA